MIHMERTRKQTSAAQLSDKRMEQESVRLFVGGLPASVEEQEIKNRFEIYGGSDFEIVAKDALNDQPTKICYFTLTGPNSKSQSDRVISAWNNVSWKGSKIRVAKAKPHYIQRLQEAREQTDKEPPSSESVSENRRRDSKRPYALKRIAEETTALIHMKQQSKSIHKKRKITVFPLEDDVNYEQETSDHRSSDANEPDNSFENVESMQNNNHNNNAIASERRSSDPELDDDSEISSSEANARGGESDQKDRPNKRKKIKRYNTDSTTSIIEEKVDEEKHRVSLNAQPNLETQQSEPMNDAASGNKQPQKVGNSGLWEVSIDDSRVKIIAQKKTTGFRLVVPDLPEEQIVAMNMEEAKEVEETVIAVQKEEYWSPFMQNGLYSFYFQDECNMLGHQFCRQETEEIIRPRWFKWRKQFKKAYKQKFKLASRKRKSLKSFHIGMM